MSTLVCPACGTELKMATGIGPFCPNTACPVGDAPALYQSSEEPKLPVLLTPKQPTIRGILVIQSSGPDVVYLHFNAPLGTWPFTENGLSASFEVAQGNGVEYVREHFGIEPRTVDIK